MTNNEPLIELAYKHVAIVAQSTGIRLSVYDLPGGLTPCVAWAAPGDEGYHFAVFLALHPDRLLNELLHLTPYDLLGHYEPAELCDAYVLGFIGSDGTLHTEKTASTVRGQTDLHLATCLLQARAAKRLAIDEVAASCTVSAVH